MSRSSGRRRWLLVAILAIGGLLRSTYLIELAQAPDFAAPQFEAQYHDYWARALVTDDWRPPDAVTDPEIRSRPFFRPPGYPYFLAAIYRFAGLGYLIPRLLQMAMGLGSVVLLYVLSRRRFGDDAGLATAAVAATYWIFIFFEGELMAPAVLVFLLLLALVAADRWCERLGLAAAAAAAFPLGLAILVRPNMLVLPPVFVAWAAWLRWRRTGRPAALINGDFLRPVATFIVVILICVLPVTWRNHRVANDRVLITSNAGINLFVGTHPDSDGYTPGVPELGELSGLDGWDSFDYPIIAAAVAKSVGQPLKDSQVSSYFTWRALDHALHDPAAVLGLMARKLALFFGSAEISNNKVIMIERERSPSLSFGLGFSGLLALALYGGALFWRDRKRPADTGAGAGELALLLVLVIAVYSASFLPFFVAARFRVPILPLLMVFAGYGVAGAWRFLHRRAYRALAVALVVMAAIRLVVGIEWIPYEPDEGLWHWRRGLLFRAQNDAERAAAELTAAVLIDADNAEAQLALGDSLVALGRLDEALIAYRQAVAEKPRWVAAHNNLALALAQHGDRRAAIWHWQRVLELDDERLSALNNLAFVLATAPEPEIADPQRAVILAQRACELTRYRDPALLATLEIAYRAAGREREAIETRERGQALTTGSMARARADSARRADP